MSYSIAAAGEAETLQSGLIEPGDRDDAGMTKLPDEPAMPVKPKDCFEYVRQDPCERYPFIVYWIIALYALVMLVVLAIGVQNGTNLTGNVITLCIIALLTFSYAAYTFRIALALREQVNEFARKNAEFKSQNAQLSAEVDSLGKANQELRTTENSLKQSNEKMMENVKKFTQLQNNLQKFTGGNIAGMEEFQKKCGSMSETWRQTLIKNEKSMFMRIFDEMEMKDEQPDMSREEYTAFLNLLPADYKKLFEDHHKTWEEMAGDDNIMQFEEFRQVVDEIVEAHVDNDMHE